MLIENRVNRGIAGWPLRDLSLVDIADAIKATPCELVEIPKDLLDSVSIKKLFDILQASNKTVAFAGTTDFATLSGLPWSDYQNYLDIQAAAARFLKSRYWRVFLQAPTLEELEFSIRKVIDYSRRIPEVEIVIETHGGPESTMEGFNFCLKNSSINFVVDFSNILDTSLREFIAQGGLRERIAYFHVRNIPGYREEASLAPIEAKAARAYPQHAFLWEPKVISGRAAVDMFRRYDQAG